ncbi:hypothetical protein LINPERHAP1_LOCUS35202 [Linum perenne]
MWLLGWRERGRLEFVGWKYKQIPFVLLNCCQKGFLSIINTHPLWRGSSSSFRKTGASRLNSSTRKLIFLADFLANRGHELALGVHTVDNTKRGVLYWANYDLVGGSETQAVII